MASITLFDALGMARLIFSLSGVVRIAIGEVKVGVVEVIRGVGACGTGVGVDAMTRCYDSGWRIG